MFCLFCSGVCGCGGSTRSQKSLERIEELCCEQVPFQQAPSLLHRAAVLPKPLPPSHPAPSHPPHPIPPPTPNPPTPACPSGNPRHTNTLPGAMEKSSINLLLRKGRSHNGTNKFSFSEQPGTSLGQLAYKCGQTTSCSLRRSETRGLYCSPPVLNTMQSLEGFTSQPASQSSVRMGK